MTVPGILPGKKNIYIDILQFSFLVVFLTNKKVPAILVYNTIEKRVSMATYKVKYNDCAIKYRQYNKKYKVNNNSYFPF